MNWRPARRGFRNLELSGWSVSDFVMDIFGRLSLGTYTWPIHPANDKDHATW